MVVRAFWPVQIDKTRQCVNLSPMIASPALLALREATASAHETLEVQARIEPRLSDPATRAATVAAFYRFHAGLEPLSHPLVARLNAEVDAGFEPRSRANGIAQDEKRAA